MTTGNGHESGIKLVAFDMDGVLTRVKSSWKYVHDRMGVDNSVNLTRYLRGEINYEQFMVSDVKLWLDKYGKVHRDTISEVLSEIPLRTNVAHAIGSLRDKGIRVAIISGGISWLSDRIDDDVPFDEVFANEIGTDTEGFLTTVCHPTVVPERKGDVVRALQTKWGLAKQECVSVGDSIFDRSMFDASGLSIAFNPENLEVSHHATRMLESDNLDDLLPHILLK